ESNKKENSVLLTNFYNQSKVLLHTFSEYRKTSQVIRKNELGTNISKLHTELESIYKHFLLEQQFIAMIFFVSTIFILLLFIILHFRALKNRRKLLAFNLAIEHSDNAIMITDPNRNIVFVNEAFEETTGYSADEVLGKNPRILKSDLQDESIYVEINQQLSKGESWQGEFINKRKDGTLFYERASIVPIMLNNKLINYLAIKLDITDYVEQNARLQQAASVFENTEEAIIIADALGNVLSVNNAFTHIYGYSLKDVKGKNLSLIRSGLQSESFYKKMWEDILQNDLFRGKLFNRTKSGEVIPVWVTIKTIRNKAGDIVNFTSVQTDLRAIENSEEKANYLAYHDPLTGLSNRTSLEEFVMQTLNLAKRNDKKFAILFIDLDRFKVINDTLGHDIGDKVLVKVTKRLKKILRKGDFLARWGGDEFVVILHDIISESFMATVARKIINGLKKTIHIGHHDFNITASIGISIYPENGDDANTLIK
ncbi:MAG: diguanylate cyclase, partial [Campylobacterales bacterium]|nr:diguanylate cyclase [Campylobacterales bacterium]